MKCLESVFAVISALSNWIILLNPKSIFGHSKPPSNSPLTSKIVVVDHRDILSYSDRFLFSERNKLGVKNTPFSLEISMFGATLERHFVHYVRKHSWTIGQLYWMVHKTEEHQVFYRSIHFHTWLSLCVSYTCLLAWFSTNFSPRSHDVHSNIMKSYFLFNLIRQRSYWSRYTYT